MGGGAAGFAGTSVCLHTPRYRFLSRGCVFGAVDVVDVELTWQSPRELEIAYRSKADDVITTLSDRWRDVKIRFARRPLDLPR
jgi:hypothetical protein